MAATATRERELKLEAPDGFTAGLLPGEPFAARLFTSTYYDTADGRLARAGITLRRRLESGTSRWQLKLPRDGYRLEVETLGGPAGPPEPLAEALTAAVRGAPLAVVATLRTRREGTRVAEGGAEVAEIVLDDVAILDAQHVVGGFRELEIELLDGGTEETLSRLGKTVRAAGATRATSGSKLARALAFEPPRPVGRAAPAADQLREFLQEQVVALVSHDVGVRLGGPPAELHQLRVASRRIRAALRAAGPIVLAGWAEPLREELGWLGTALGAARDLDVLTERLRRQAADLGAEDEAAFAPLLSALERERAERAAELRETLRSERYLDLVEALQAAAAAPQVLDRERPVRELARAPFRRLRKAMDALDADAPDDELHRARILAKRARYAGELAQRAEKRSAARFVDRAKAFQDLLGEHQDASVAEEVLRRLAAGSDSVGVLAAGRLVERQHAERERSRARLDRAWRKLERAGARAWA